MKNKAQTQFNLFTFMIFSLLVVVFFGGLIYAFGLINDVMHQTGVINDRTYVNGSIYVNMTQASDNIFGKVNESIQALRMVAIVYILAMAVIIILTNAFMKVHPIFFFPYILICVLAVILAVPISNAYETLLNSNIYDGGLSSFEFANYLLANLPTLVLIVGVLGSIFLFINLIRGGYEQTLQ
jgi:hypothetical protein